MDSLTNTLLTKTAKMAKKIRDSGNENIKRSKRASKDCSVQEYIPVKDIVDGFVITTDSRYLMILEIDSINFDGLSDETQQSIINNFTRLFQKNFKKASIHILTDNYSPRKIWKSMDRANKDETDPQRISMIAAYKGYIQRISYEASVVKRYFLVVEYTGDSEGKRSYDKEEIIQQMQELRLNTISTLKAARTKVMYDPKTDNPSAVTADILYYFFNRRSYNYTNITERRQRAKKDYEEYYKETGSNKKATIIDIISPKGLRFDKTSYVYQDGYYMTYLGAKGDGWPLTVIPAWLNTMDRGSDNIDITVRFTAMPKDATLKALTILTRNRRLSVKEKLSKNRIEEAEDMQEKYQNSQFIVQALNGMDDLFNVNLIVTIRNSDKKEAELLKRRYIKANQGLFEFEDSWLCAEDYYRATMPLLCKASCLARLNRQVISSHIGVMYPFNENKINQPSGYLLGLHENQPVVLDNFNKAYPNGNMFVIGTSGAGKTFTQCVLSGRYSLNGTRINCICPAKGFEYKGLTTLYNGQYINLAPGSKHCLNIMDITSEAKLDSDDENAAVVSKDSVLSKKIRMLTEWFSLNMSDGKEGGLSKRQLSEMTVLLHNVYGKFGITDEPDSLFNEDGTKRTMPILQDWYDELLKSETVSDLAYVLEYYINGGGKYLNAQTNVDLSRMITVYDVSFDQGAAIPKEYGPAYMFLAFQTANAKVKEDLDRRDMVVIDEAWMMLRNEDCANQVSDAIKLYRSYHGCCIIATQELADFAEGAGNHGKTVLNICAIKLLMKCSEASVPLLKEIYGISKEGAEEMMNYEPGQGLLIADTNRMKVKVMPMQEEMNAYDTSRGERK